MCDVVQIRRWQYDIFMAMKYAYSCYAIMKAGGKLQPTLGLSYKPKWAEPTSCFDMGK